MADNNLLTRDWPNPILQDDEEETTVLDETGNDEAEVKLSKAEYEKLMKKAEALDSSTKEAQLQNEAIKIRKDRSNFVALYERSPKIAQQVADKFFDGANAKEAYQKLKGETPSAKSDVLDEGKIEEILERREAEKKFTKLRNETWIDEDSKLWKKIKEEYEDLIEWKKLNKERVEKYFKLALMNVKNISKYAEELDKVKGMWGIWQGKLPSNAIESPSFFKDPKHVKDTRFKKK